MTKHYSEADLLETYYMQPGQSLPVMMHLAECNDCAARYERLEHKLREAASCHTTTSRRPSGRGSATRSCAPFARAASATSWPPASGAPPPPRSWPFSSAAPSCSKP